VSASAVAAPLPWLVVTTVGSREQAQQLARAIVHLRLAACAQIEAIVYAAWVAESSTGQGDRAPIGDLL
jgi:hypothetical protein